MSGNNDKILQQKITDLPFSEDFKSVTTKLGFKTIAELLVPHVSTLTKLDGFTYHMLQEFIQYMQENNLSHLIKQH